MELGVVETVQLACLRAPEAALVEAALVGKSFHVSLYVSLYVCLYVSLYVSLHVCLYV